MLKKKEISSVCDEACELAKYFVEGYLPQDADLTENYHGRVRRSYILGALAQFVFDLSGAYIGLMEFDPSGFASWLYSDEDGIHIVLDPRQMQVWHQQNALPIHTQRLRCVIHELGHIFLSPIVLTEEAAEEEEQTKFGIKSQALPEIEEEKAWLFTFTFIALMLGDYSYRRRTGKGDDNTVMSHV